jgi:molecular chaperone DnaK (HSP70)
VRALAKLRRAATNAKIQLSQELETLIEIENWIGVDFECTLTRAQFEKSSFTVLFRDSEIQRVKELKNYSDQITIPWHKCKEQ